MGVGDETKKETSQNSVPQKILSVTSKVQTHGWRRCCCTLDRNTFCKGMKHPSRWPYSEEVRTPYHELPNNCCWDHGSLSRFSSSHLCLCTQSSRSKASLLREQQAQANAWTFTICKRPCILAIEWHGSLHFHDPTAWQA